MRKKILIFLFLGIISKCYSQKESNNWYFGKNFGITFNTLPPSVLIPSRINTQEGCASISTKTGKLLFYTDGSSIWDSSHNIMPNGSGLKGHSSSTQSAIIVPAPGDTNLFYLFTMDQSATPLNIGMHYNIIDMRLNGGKGDVVNGKKNIAVIRNLTERLTAIRHKNKIDFWILIQKRRSDSVLVYRLNQAGFDTIPIVNKLNKWNAYHAKSAGYMKASPDGKKLAICAFSMDSTVKSPRVSDTSLIADFDNKTGVISNVWFFPSKGGSYGIEFSPGSKFLYMTQISTFSPIGIFQYDLSALNVTDFINSKFRLDSISFAVGALQLGPDGKIYFNNTNGLNVIHAPDSQGVSCRYQLDFIKTKDFTYAGLPNFVNSFILNKNLTYKRNCLQDTCQIKLEYNVLVDSIKWLFGDNKIEMALNPKDSPFVYHVFEKPGIHKVYALCFYNAFIDTVGVDIEILDHRPKLPNDTLICHDFSFKLTSKGKYQKYFWPHDSSTNDFAEIKSGGSFVLNVIDSIGCRGTDTIQIKNPIFQTRINTVDSLQCFDSNTFYMSFTSKVLNDTLKSINWNASDGSTSIDSFWNKSFGVSGKYKITLTLTGASQCRDTSYSFLEVFRDQKGKILSNNDSVCLEGNQFDFNYNSNFVKHHWNFGDGDSASNAHPAKKYSTPGKYRINYIGADSNGCVYSDSLNVLVIKATNHAILSADTQCLKGNLFYGTLDSAKLSYDWNMGDGTVYNKKIIKHKYSKTGSFDVVVQTKDSLSCLSSDTFKVHVLESPLAKFSIDSMKCSDMVTFIDGSVNSSNRIWKIENDTFLAYEFKYKVNGNKKLNVMLISYNQQSLCPDTIKAEIDFSNLLSGGKLIVPNVFTPGTIDAINDLYKLGGLNHDCGDVADVQIYNRWGVLVYKGDLSSEPWNGTLMNQGEALSAGTYYYILKVSRGSIVNTGEVEQVSGVIYLIR